MSRTRKDIPYRIALGCLPAWCFRHYPARIGGAWSGRKEWARIRNRQHRLRARQALRLGQEPPAQKRGVTWDLY